MAQKEYIGSGKKHSSYDSVTVTLDLNKAAKHAYETEHGTYITFVVSARKETDRYGKTHTAFILADEPVPAAPVEPTAVAEPTEQPKKKARKKK